MDKIAFVKPTLGKEEHKAVERVLNSGWLAAGKETALFEEEFAKYVGVKYAIFTNSGTSALKMAYKYAKEQGVLKAWIPMSTFSATYAAAEEIGIQSLLFKKLNEGEQSKEKNWKDEPWDSNIKVNVHYGGVKDENPCVLEDSAHRIEANDPLIGKIRIYSFYVTKNITTGAGGMLVTDDEEIYKKCRLYWQDGIDKSTYDRQNGGWNYEVKTMAGGYDGNDLAAAIGREQLKKLPEFTSKRNTIRDLYNQSFNQTWEGNHLYPFMVKNETQVGRLIDYLKSEGIQASYHYPGTGWLGVSLPIYPLLTAKEQAHIINQVLLWKSEED